MGSRARGGCGVHRHGKASAAAYCMPDMNTDTRIYVAGHRGLAGSALVRGLTARGYTNIVTRTHTKVDLLDPAAVAALFQAERPQVVFLAAARVGGILANSTFPAEFIQDNLVIQANVIHE